MELNAAEVLGLYARYCYYLDNDEPELFSELFGDDGVLYVGDRQEVRDRAGLVEFAGTAPKGVHMAGLPWIVDAETGEVRASWSFANAAGGLVCGYYRDRLARGAMGELIFAERRIELKVRQP